MISPHHIATDPGLPPAESGRNQQSNAKAEGGGLVASGPFSGTAARGSRAPGGRAIGTGNATCIDPRNACRPPRTATAIWAWASPEWRATAPTKLTGQHKLSNAATDGNLLAFSFDSDLCDALRTCPDAARLGLRVRERRVARMSAQRPASLTGRALRSRRRQVPACTDSAHGDHDRSTAELEPSRASQVRGCCKHQSGSRATGGRTAGCGQNQQPAPRCPF
jgi:hypothetical protein